MCDPDITCPPEGIACRQVSRGVLHFRSAPMNWAPTMRNALWGIEPKRQSCLCLTGHTHTHTSLMYTWQYWKHCFWLWGDLDLLESNEFMDSLYPKCVNGGGVACISETGAKFSPKGTWVPTMVVLLNPDCGPDHLWHIINSSHAQNLP